MFHDLETAICGSCYCFVIFVLAAKDMYGEIKPVRTSNQSQGTREHIPGVGTNHRGLQSIFQ
eukprot:4680668-Pyramimonas_sp.AAC.1